MKWYKYMKQVAKGVGDVGEADNDILLQLKRRTIAAKNNSKEEYFQYVKQILQRLIDKKMPVAIKKYKFHTTKTKFCGFIIKLKKLSIDLKKIKVIVNW